MGELAGRIALVTGGQQGIGAAIALALARAGADVALTWLDAEPLALAQAIRALGRRCVCLQGSLASHAGVIGLHQAACASLGVPDLLVNNAGIFPRCDFLAMTEAEWDAVLTVNLKAAAFMTQAFARALSGREAAVVNLSSSAVRGDPRGVHYVASKCGIIGLTRATALALAPAIRVNAIAPGLIDTAQPRLAHSEEALAARAAAQPIPRLGRPEEVAELAVYLLGPRAGYITGQVFHINGGVYLA
ncbi:MAG: SDR family oxidoreductase [Rhodovarius sp.]|nr:SDR family oxidoreductase [Rhodovarius sp.]MDW8315413.1 SDR family oxidoreductase [Rhodovarius sp.]